MNYARLQEDLSLSAQDVYSAEFELDRNPATGRFIVRQVTRGTPILNDQTRDETNCVDLIGEDGQRVRLSNIGSGPASTDNHIDVRREGQPAWNTDDQCQTGGTNFFYPSADGRLKVVAYFPVPSWTRTDRNIWSVDPSADDLCHTIEDEIARAMGDGGPMGELLDPLESTPFDENVGSETRDTRAASRILRDGNLHHFFQAKTPEGNWIQMQMNADGTISPQSDQRRMIPEDLEGVIWAQADRKALSTGDEAIVAIHAATVDGRQIAKVFVLEKIAPDRYQIHLPEIEEAFDRGPVDDDGDGLPDTPIDLNGDGVIDDEEREAVDHAPGRAEPNEADINNDGTPDVVQANFDRGGWSGAEDPRETNPSGLRVGETEMGAPFSLARARDDGSVYHSNMEVVETDGGRIVEVQPGQDLYFIHSRDPRVLESTPSPTFKNPEGKGAASLTVDMIGTLAPDGSEGGPATLRYWTFDNPFGAPVEVDLPAGAHLEVTDAQGRPIPVAGYELVTRATVVRIIAGELIEAPVRPPTPTPTPSAPPESGTPEASEEPEPPATAEATPPEESAEPSATAEATPPASEDPTMRPVTPVPTGRPDTPHPSMQPTDKPREEGGDDSGCETVPGQRKNPFTMLLTFFSAAALRVLGWKRRRVG